MEIWTEPDSEDAETWISLVDDSGETESSTWPIEMYVAAEGILSSE